MRLGSVFMAFALVVDLPVTAVADAQTMPARVADTRVAHAAEAQSPLLADCTETAIMPSSLPPRPTLRRATFAHPLIRHARPKRKAPAHVVHKRRAVRHARPAHRPARHRPVLHRVTYASPLCARRSEAINDMLGLPDYDVTQPPIAADSIPGTDDVIPALVDVPPLIGSGPSPITGGPGGPDVPGGPTGPGPITGVPGIPTFPPGPGPIVLTPPDVTTPVTPPVVSNAPEPTSWATMLVGMALIGGSIRRRRAAKAA